MSTLPARSWFWSSGACESQISKPIDCLSTCQSSSLILPRQTQQQCEIKPAAYSYLHKAHHGLTQKSKMNKLSKSSGVAQMLYKYIDSESDENLRGVCWNDCHFGNLPNQRVCGHVKTSVIVCMSKNTRLGPEATGLGPGADIRAGFDQCHLVSKRRKAHSVWSFVSLNMDMQSQMNWSSVTFR